MGPEEINVDFTRPYQIKAMFANEMFSAVQLKAPYVKGDGSTGFLKVWTNVHRRSDWWAEILDAAGILNAPALTPAASAPSATSAGRSASPQAH